MKDKGNHYGKDFQFNLATLPWREMFAGKSWTAALTQSLQQWTFPSRLFQAWLLWNWDLQALVPSSGRPAAPCGSFQHWSPFQHAAAQNCYAETDGLSFECGEISPLRGRWGFSPSSSSSSVENEMNWLGVNLTHKVFWNVWIFMQLIYLGEGLCRIAETDIIRCHCNALMRPKN